MRAGRIGRRQAVHSAVWSGKVSRQIIDGLLRGVAEYRAGGRPAPRSAASDPCGGTTWRSISGYQPRCIAISSSHSASRAALRDDAAHRVAGVADALQVVAGRMRSRPPTPPLHLVGRRLASSGARPWLFDRYLTTSRPAARIDLEAVERHHARDGVAASLRACCAGTRSATAAACRPPGGSHRRCLHGLVGDRNAHFGRRGRCGGGRRGGLLGRACAKAKGQPGRGKSQNTSGESVNAHEFRHF